MVEKWESLCPTLGACGVGSYAKNIYHTRGWAEFATPQYILPRHSGKALQRFLKPRFLGTLAAPLVDGALSALGGTVRLRARRSTRGLTAVLCDQMSSEFDAALRRPRARVSTHRSAAWINWLLRGDATGRSEHRLYYAQDAQNRVVGYFLIRRTPWDFPTHGLRDVVFAGLKDWGVFDDQAADEVSIVMLAVVELLRWQADLIRIFTYDDATGRRLRKLGFIRRGALLSSYHVAPPSPLAPPEFRQPESWRMTGVEGDNYFNP